MKLNFFFISMIASSLAFAEYEFVTPAIKFQLKTKDGYPVKGASLNFELFGEHLSSHLDVSGTRVRAYPHFVRGPIDKGTFRGKTDAQGMLMIAPQKFSYTLGSRRNPTHIKVSMASDYPLASSCKTEIKLGVVKMVVLNCETILHSTDL